MWYLKTFIMNVFIILELMVCNSALTGMILDKEHKRLFISSALGFVYIYDTNKVSLDINLLFLMWKLIFSKNLVF